MAKLNLSIAVRDYDRTRPLTDGTVQIDGVDPVFMALDPEEIFFRAFRHAEFDICELSLSSSTVKTAQRDFAYVGVPAFVSRAFRHTSIYVRTDRVKQPADLKGRRVGISEYQLTANVWTRALLEDQYGVKPSDLHWIRGGLEQAGRVEKIAITLPSDTRLDPAPEGTTLNAMLEATSASKVTLPFMEEQVKAARDFMGADFWPYGIPANRKTLEYFLAQHHKQGLSSRLVKVEELFHPTTFETYKV